MSRILVTGSNGFMGKALMKALQDKNYEVVGIDLPEYDITVEGVLEKFLTKNISHVFHLAARSFVPDSWKNPTAFYKTNVVGTAGVVEFCRQSKSKLIFISSYVYGHPDYLPIDENHPLKSYNPYSRTKIIAEEICEFYKEQYKTEITIFRPFNMYGPGQSSQFLIPEIINKVLNDEVVEVMDLIPKRDYIFIDDVIRALVLSVEKPAGTYNIGSGYSVSVEEVIKKILKVSGINKKYIAKNIPRENEVNDVVASISKIQNELGWKPEITLEQGIQKFFEQKN